MAQKKDVICNVKKRQILLTLLLLSFLVPTPFSKGEGGRPSNLKNRCPHEREILQGIRDTFESLRNVKVVYIVLTWLP